MGERVMEGEAAIRRIWPSLNHRMIKKKGYARLTTNYGPLNLELYCDVVPKTCENFLKLRAKGTTMEPCSTGLSAIMLQARIPTGNWVRPVDSLFGGTLRTKSRSCITLAMIGAYSGQLRPKHQQIPVFHITQVV